MGCDLIVCRYAKGSQKFQSTHPSGVRPYMTNNGVPVLIFQSTHPSGVRQESRPGGAIQEISIHAPQWGATRGFIRWDLIKIFQSTHPSGVRLLSLSRRRISEQFQSTHPSGVRLAPALGTRANPVISIHAPQWGATGLLFVGHAQPLISIHAPQWGATGIELPRKPQRKQFQSTHPSGVRRGRKTE